MQLGVVAASLAASMSTRVHSYDCRWFEEERPPSREVVGHLGSLDESYFRSADGMVQQPSFESLVQAAGLSSMAKAKKEVDRLSFALVMVDEDDISLRGRAGHGNDDVVQETKDQN